MIRLAFCSSGCCRISAVSAADLPVLNRSTLTEMPRFSVLRGPAALPGKIPGTGVPTRRLLSAEQHGHFNDAGYVDRPDRCAFRCRFRSRMLRQGNPVPVGRFLAAGSGHAGCFPLSVRLSGSVRCRPRSNRPADPKRLPSE